MNKINLDKDEGDYDEYIEDNTEAPKSDESVIRITEAE